MTNKEIILEALKANEEHHNYYHTYNSTGLSCSELSAYIATKKGITKQNSRYLNGSVSSILNKMVKDNILDYNPNRKGIKGGYIYILKYN